MPTLAVAPQTVREGQKFDVEVCYQRKPERDAAITITNYEMLEHFDTDRYEAIILDESSIIKHFEGKFRNLIIERFQQTPYKLACTATPAPNSADGGRSRWSTSVSRRRTHGRLVAACITSAM